MVSRFFKVPMDSLAKPFQLPPQPCPKGCVMYCFYSKDRSVMYFKVEGPEWLYDSSAVDDWENGVRGEVEMTLDEVCADISRGVL